MTKTKSLKSEVLDTKMHVMILAYNIFSVKRLIMGNTVTMARRKRNDELVDGLCSVKIRTSKVT